MIFTPLLQGGAQQQSAPAPAPEQPAATAGYLITQQRRSGTR